MRVLIRISGKGTVQTIWKYLTFSSILKVLSLISAVLTTIQGYHEPTPKDGMQDIKLWMGVITTIALFVSKQNNEHGTPTAPISTEQAAKVATIAAAVPTSVVGAPMEGSAHIFMALPGDLTPVGQTRTDDQGAKFLRLSDKLYEKVT